MRTLFIFFFIFVLNSAPLVAFAGDDALVPCGRGESIEDACTICHFIVLFDNVIDFITGLLFITAMTILVVAGVIYIVSAGNQGLISLAKTAIKGALIGAIVVLVAWVLITWGISSLAADDGPLNIYKVEGGAWDFQCAGVSGGGE